MSRSWGAPAAAVLLLLGLASLAQGAWIHVKAELAQVLLERAWARARDGDERARPWPWADTWPVARLRAPGVDASLIVLAGATGASLPFGPGHLDGTPLPGAAGNAVLAGHRDTHFAFLEQLEAGDELWVETVDGGVYGFVVDGLAVVHERERWPLAESAEPRLTLLTCYPFDAIRAGGPLRYVVGSRSSRSMTTGAPR